MKIQRTNQPERPLIFKFNYDSNVVDACRQIKNEVGFLNFGYDGDRKGWVFNFDTLDKVKNIFPFVFIPADILNEHENIKAEAERDRIRKETAKTEPLKINLPLFDYQKIGANFMVANKKVMNNDDMGLGKTLQSIAVIHYLNFKNGLIVTPNSLKSNWQRELIKWINRPSIIVEEKIHQTGINILNYEKLIKFSTTSDKGRIRIHEALFKNFEFVIFDECHYIKEMKSKRSKLALQICKLIDRVILLTGTPMLNRPKELIAQINAVDFMHEFKSDWHFMNRYCDPKNNGFGIDFNGASNIPELKIKLEKFSIRRLKQDVLKDLPDKMINNIYIDLPEPETYRSIENASQQEIIDSDDVYQTFYKNLAGKTPEQRAEIIARSRMEGQFKSLNSNILVQIEKLKQESARQKVLASKDIFNEYIENKKKVVVFCTHKKTVADLNNLYKQSVVITGEVEPEQRIKNIDKFETDPETLFLFCTLQTTGTGFNLTASSEVLFMELGWTPAEHKQAEDRCWRIGQKNKVNINYLIAINTIDEDIIEILNNKSEVIEGTFKGELLNKQILKIFSDRNDTGAKNKREGSQTRIF